MGTASLHPILYLDPRITKDASTHMRFPTIDLIGTSGAPNLEIDNF